MPRDPIVLDPATPPGGADAVETLLWRGCCPWCGIRSSFIPSEVFDGSLICMCCGLEFAGTVHDEPGVVPQRTVTAVYVEGDPGMTGGAPDDLPEVTPRT